MIRRTLLGCLAYPALTILSSPAFSQQASAMANCAAIGDPTQRLSCYDQLARTQGLPVAASPTTANQPSVPATAGRSSGPESPPPPSVLDTAAAPANVPVPVPPPVPTPVPPTAAIDAQQPPVQPPAPASMDPKEAFGLYAAEHPQAAAPTQLKEIKAVVTGIGTARDGHPTVSLEGDQVWELDGMDELLATGQTVTISRGTLRSFILTTRSGRSYKARRLH